MQIYCNGATKARVTIGGKYEVVSDYPPIGVETTPAKLIECILYYVKGYTITHMIPFGVPCPAPPRAVQTLYYEGEVRGQAILLNQEGCETLGGGFLASSWQYSRLAFKGKQSNCIDPETFYLPAVRFDPDPPVPSTITNSGNHYTYKAEITDAIPLETQKNPVAATIKIYDSYPIIGNTPQRKFYEATIDNPSDFKVICGDCPEGTIRCEQPGYPGYCCLPCKPIAERINNLAARI